MSQNYPFVRDDVLPSFWANRIQDILSGASFDVDLTKKGTNYVQVVPRVAQPGVGDDAGIAALIIDGKWRFNTATIERQVPGDGVWLVWAVAFDNDITDSPDPFTDHTDYSWDLRMTATNAVPSGPGVEIHRILGSVGVVNGVITSVDQQLYSVGMNRRTGGVFSDTGSGTPVTPNFRVPNLKVTPNKAGIYVAEITASGNNPDANRYVELVNSSGAVIARNGGPVFRAYLTSGIGASEIALVYLDGGDVELKQTGGTPTAISASITLAYLGSPEPTY